MSAIPFNRQELSAFIRQSEDHADALRARVADAPSCTLSHHEVWEITERLTFLIEIARAYQTATPVRQAVPPRDAA